MPSLNRLQFAAALAVATITFVSGQQEWTCVEKKLPLDEGGDGSAGMDGPTCGGPQTEDQCKTCCEESDICNAFAQERADGIKGTCYFKKEYDINRKVEKDNAGINWCYYNKKIAPTPPPVSGPAYDGLWKCYDGQTPAGEGGDPVGIEFGVQANGNTRLQCVAACHRQPTCNGFAYLNTDSWTQKGACFFKTAAGFNNGALNENPLYDFCFKDSSCTSDGADGCFAAEKPAPQTPPPTQSPIAAMLWHCQEERLPTIEGTGGIPGDFKGTRQQCSDACSANAGLGCNAFVWKRDESACYLKTGFDASTADFGNGPTYQNVFDFCYHIPGATSQASQQVCVNGKLPPYEGVATEGGFDYDSEKTVSRYGCAELCNTNPACNAFVWTVDKRECHLKSKYTQVETDYSKWTVREDADFCFDPFRPHSFDYGFECRDGQLPSWEGEGVESTLGEDGYADAEACILGCKNNKECTSAVYNKFSKKCYFKKWFDINAEDLKWKGQDNDAWEHEFFFCWEQTTSGSEYDCSTQMVPKQEGIPVTEDSHAGKSRGECQIICDGYTDCNAFAFTRDTGVCHLKQKFDQTRFGDKLQWDANVAVDFCFNSKKDFTEGSDSMTCKNGNLPVDEGQGLIGGEAYDADKDTCMSACIIHESCTAIVYDTQAKKCYWKMGFDSKNAVWDTKATTIFDFCYIAGGNSIAGDFTCAERKQPGIEGVGIAKNIGATTRYGCAESCSTEPTCNAFVWNRAGDNCFLKSKFSVEHMGATSTWKQTNGSDFCWDADNSYTQPVPAMGLHCVDNMVPSVEGDGVVDGDLTGLTRPECAEECSLKTTCNAFAWKRDGGGCHLKTGFNAAAQHGWAANELFDFCYTSGNSDALEKVLVALRTIAALVSPTAAAAPASCTADPASCNPEVTSNGLDLNIKAPFGKVSINTNSCGAVDPCMINKIIEVLADV